MLICLGEKCHRKCDKRGHSYPWSGLADRLPGHAAGGHHDHPRTVKLRYDHPRTVQLTYDHTRTAQV